MFTLRVRYICILLFAAISIVNCQKQETEDSSDDQPEYQPGRLIEVSYEDYELGSIYRKYEYAENTIIDKYYYSSPEIFISKYYFNNYQLEKVVYSIENASDDIFHYDSLTYYYSGSQIKETAYRGEDSFNEVYEKENGRITFSSNNQTSFRKDCYYEWSGDNLTQFTEHQWTLGSSPIITEYIFEYSDIKNPFFYSNIPRFMEDFTNQKHGLIYELPDLIPKCSRNFPLKLTINDQFSGWKTIYSFQCKTFSDSNLPYEVRVIIYDERLTENKFDYYLTYEEL